MQQWDVLGRRYGQGGHQNERHRCTPALKHLAWQERHTEAATRRATIRASPSPPVAEAEAEAEAEGVQALAEEVGLLVWLLLDWLLLAWQELAWQQGG